MQIYKIVAACLSVLVIESRAQQLSIMIMKDNFDDNRFNWFQEKQDSSIREVVNGKYFYENKSTKGWFYRRAFPLQKHLFTSVNATMTLNEGIMTRAFGLLASYKDNRNYVELGVAANGYYRCEAIVNDKLNAISNGWKKSDIVKTGYGQPNIFRIDVKGKQYDFYLNGTLIESATLNDQPDAENVGFSISSKQLMSIDDFELKQWGNNELPGKVLGAGTAMAGETYSKPFPSKNGIPRPYRFETDKIVSGSYHEVKQGLVDKDGYRVLDPIYERISEFKEARASLYRGVLTGTAVIDDRLNLLTPFIFNWVEPFEKGYAVARIGEKYGLINAEGKMVLPFVYQALGKPDNGFLCAKMDGKSGIISITGEVMVPFGKITVPPRNSINLVNGTLCTSQETQSTVGVIDKQGKWLVEPKYKSLVANDDGTYTFSLNHPVKSYSSVYGLISKEGKVLIPATYGEIVVSGENLILGNDESGGDYGAKSNKSRYALADKKGTLLTEMKYLKIFPSKYDPGYFTAAVEIPTDPTNRYGTFGVIDKKGKEVIPCTYENKVKVDDWTGTLAFMVPQFSEGLLRISKDNKYGYVDKTNKIVLPVVFTGADTFENGIAGVTKDGVYQYIDKTGKKVESEREAKYIKLLPPVRK